jgi:hypothetical protein
VVSSKPTSTAVVAILHFFPYLSSYCIAKREWEGDGQLSHLSTTSSLLLSFSRSPAETLHADLTWVWRHARFHTFASFFTRGTALNDFCNSALADVSASFRAHVRKRTLRSGQARIAFLIYPLTTFKCLRRVLTIHVAMRLIEKCRRKTTENKIIPHTHTHTHMHTVERGARRQR